MSWKNFMVKTTSFRFSKSWCGNRVTLPLHRIKILKIPLRNRESFSTRFSFEHSNRNLKLLNSLRILNLYNFGEQSMLCIMLVVPKTANDMHNSHLGGLFMHQKRGRHWKKSTKAMQRRVAENKIRTRLSEKSAELVFIFRESFNLFLLFTKAAG